MATRAEAERTRDSGKHLDRARDAGEPILRAYARRGQIIFGDLKKIREIEGPDSDSNNVRTSLVESEGEGGLGATLDYRTQSEGANQ